MERDPQSPSGKPEGQMDDILASIRRILQSDGPEDAAKPSELPSAHGAPDTHIPAAPGPETLDDVFDLHPSMRVATPHDVPEPGLDAFDPASRHGHTAPPAGYHPDPFAGPDEPHLLGAGAAAQSSASLAALREALAASDAPKPVASPPIYRSGGLTIEDVVRDEVRTLLRGWLDDNLPPMVERLVRAEIARIAGQG